MWALKDSRLIIIKIIWTVLIDSLVGDRLNQFPFAPVVSALTLPMGRFGQSGGLRQNEHVFDQPQLIIYSSGKRGHFTIFDIESSKQKCFSNQKRSN